MGERVRSVGMWSHYSLSHNGHKMTCGAKAGVFCFFVLLFLVVVVVSVCVFALLCVELLYGGGEWWCVHAFH